MFNKSGYSRTQAIVVEKGIQFGTDGWRSRMDEDFTSKNIRRVAKAIAEYVLSTKGKKGIFVGYDGRTNSRNFAEACAEVIASSGIECFLPTRAVPTPVSAFAAVKYSLSGAVMITASHNPAIYNGVKFIPDYGGPATTEITQKIEKLIPKVPPSNLSFQTLWQKGKISELDPLDSYAEHVERLLEVKAFDLDVAIDPMHGSTSGIFDSILRRLGTRVHAIRSDIDPLFGGVVPDPVKPNLSELLRATLGSSSSLGIALDGDGDRVAAVTENGDFLMANQLLPLIYLHMMADRSLVGDAARTVATSHLVDKVAEDHGRKAIEVPVGFKYIGALLRDKEVVVGGEESGGISIITHIPEKDGIVSALMIIEDVIMSGRSLGTMMKELTEKYGTFFSSRIDLIGKIPTEPLKNLNFRVGQKIIGKKISRINMMDGMKLLLDDGSWLLFRVSGTENLIRVYAESATDGETASLIDFGRKSVLE